MFDIEINFSFVLTDSKLIENKIENKTSGFLYSWARDAIESSNQTKIQSNPNQTKLINIAFDCWSFKWNIFGFDQQLLSRV